MTISPMTRKGVLLVAAVGALAGCDGLKEAMTAHVDTVARAGASELTVERLGGLLGNSPQIPISGPQGREVAKNLSGLWVDYHLLAQAAAAGDSLTDAKTMDAALWAVIAQERIRKLGEKVLASAPLDTSNASGRYDRGELLAARHILIGFGGQPQPGQQVPAAKRDSALRRAQAVRGQVTTANFADLARRNSSDPGSAAQGGSLGVFPKGVMVPQFEQAVTALKPGEISQPVETPFGFHIIYRPQFAEVNQEFTRAIGQRTRQVAESSYIANLEKQGKVEVKGDAALWTKSVAADVEGHRKDDKVVATSAAGDLTAGRIAQWIGALPGGPQLRQQIQQAPDSLVTQFVRSIARNELLLKQADSAKVQVDSAETNNLKTAYVAAVNAAWTGLGIAPTTLADSAKDKGAKEKLAASRIESYLDRLTQQKAQFVEVPPPISAALRAKYEFKINDQGLDRALERAAQLRSKADSSRAANQPATAVPLPGAPGAPGAAPGGPAPTGQAPTGPAPAGQAPTGGAAPARP